MPKSLPTHLFTPCLLASFPPYFVKFAQVNASIDRQYDSMTTANSLHLAKNLTAQSVRAEIRRQTLRGRVIY